MNDLNVQTDERIKILYVDDDQVNLQLFTLTFMNDLEVITADSGLIALHILNTTNDFHAVVSDFNMPNMNGLQFITKAKEIKNDIPYFILSGSFETEEFREALENNMIDFFFRKPLNKDFLLREIFKYYTYSEVNS